MVPRDSLPDSGIFSPVSSTNSAVRWDCSPEDMARIPRSGPVVIVANHPFGLAEGPTMGSLLINHVRPDVKFMANAMLAGREGPRGLPDSRGSFRRRRQGQLARHPPEY